MRRDQLTTTVTPLEEALSPDRLNHLARESGFCQRYRQIDPAELAISLVAALGSQAVESLADLHRYFQQMTTSEVGYRAFHDRLCAPHFDQFMLSCYTHQVGKLCLDVLRTLPDNPYGRFDAILIQDGTSFAVHDSLKTALPGRFHTVKPAAVEIHATLELKTESCRQVAVGPDTQSERTFLPKPDELKDQLLLADQGYGSARYFQAVDQAGGFYLIRVPQDWNPQVVGIWHGAQLFPLRQSVALREWRALWPGQVLDVEVQWSVDGQPYVGRMVLLRLADGKWMHLATNLPAAEFSSEAVLTGYRLRWQVELLFKEWKSYANLHQFETRSPSAAMGLIWASLMAATWKRFLAHATQWLYRVAISTRKTAMSAQLWLYRIACATIHARSHLPNVLRDCYRFLSKAARRSHPARERQRGRLKLGFAHTQRHVNKLKCLPRMPLAA